MLRMLGRLIWVAVGALGVKAYEEASKTSTPRATRTQSGTASRSRKRKS